MKTMKALSEIRLSDADGEKIALPSLWAEGTALLVFLRHFG